MFEVKKAKRKRRPLKISLEGTSGSGKTFTALRTAFAMRMAGIGKRIVVADSENESASLYDGIVMDGEKWEYDVCPIPPEKQNPLGYAECYSHLVSQGFDIVIIDSMTHAWVGALQRVDELAARSRSGDKFSVGWKAVTPEQETMFKTITDSRAHVITTTRVKSEYDRVTQSNGKEGWGKIGTKAVQRDGAEYEYDVVVRFNNECGEHLAMVEKVRGCTAMDGKSAKCPGPDFWQTLFSWWLGASDPVAEARAAFANAKTAAELKVAWDATHGDVKPIVLADKDRRKAELSTSTPPPQPPSSASKPIQDPTAEVLSGAGGQELLKALDEFGLTWPAAAAQYGPELGFSGEAKITQITVAQSREVIRLAQADHRG